jgi:hypothetical protein
VRWISDVPERTLNCASVCAAGFDCSVRMVSTFLMGQTISRFVSFCRLDSGFVIYKKANKAAGQRESGGRTMRLETAARSPYSMARDDSGSHMRGTESKGV